MGRIAELVNALLEGQLSEEEADRLAVWLSVDEDANRCTCGLCRLHAELTLTFCEEEGTALRNTTPSYNNALDRLSDEICGVATVAATERSRVESSARNTDTAAPVDHPLIRTFSRRLVVASLATLLTMVAVFGSERIVNSVAYGGRALRLIKVGCWPPVRIRRRSTMGQTGRVARVELEAVVRRV